MRRALLPAALAVLLISAPTKAANYDLTNFGHDAQASTTQDWCRDANDYGDRDETFCEVRDLKDSGGTRLEAHTTNGSVGVTGSSRRDVSVQARIVTRARTAEEARNLARDVRVTLENGRMRADGPEFSGNWRTDRRSWTVSYRAEVPSTYDLMLDTSNGSINITGVRGDIDATSSNGSLRLTDVGGRVRARTSNGSVHVQANGTRWEGDGLSVTTSNGSARLDLPSNYNANLIVGTGNGGISLDFPITVQGRIGRRLETTLGSGGPTLEVRTSNGSVRVGRR